MKMLSVILLIVISMSGHAQQPSVDDVNMVVSTLESYKKKRLKDWIPLVRENYLSVSL